MRSRSGAKATQSQSRSRLRNQNEILIEKSDEAMRRKIKKSPFLKFFHFNFLHNLKSVVALGFLTPHGSRCATTVAIVRPLSPRGRAEAR